MPRASYIGILNQRMWSLIRKECSKSWILGPLRYRSRRKWPKLMEHLTTSPQKCSIINTMRNVMSGVAELSFILCLAESLRSTEETTMKFWKRSPEKVSILNRKLSRMFLKMRKIYSRNCYKENLRNGTVPIRPWITPGSIFLRKKERTFSIKISWKIFRAFRRKAKYNRPYISS